MALDPGLALYRAQRLPLLHHLREALSGGHWITIEDDEGVATHIYISSGGHGAGTKGKVIAGPAHLIGANIAHLPPAPHFHSTPHPEGHTPAGATSHPSYKEHKFTKHVYGKHGPGKGFDVGNPLPDLTKEEAHAGFAKAHAESKAHADAEANAAADATGVDMTTLGHLDPADLPPAANTDPIYQAPPKAAAAAPGVDKDSLHGTIDHPRYTHLGPHTKAALHKLVDEGKITGGAEAHHRAMLASDAFMHLQNGHISPDEASDAEMEALQPYPNTVGDLKAARQLLADQATAGQAALQAPPPPPEPDHKAELKAAASAASAAHIPEYEWALHGLIDSEHINNMADLQAVGKALNEIKAAATNGEINPIVTSTMAANVIKHAGTADLTQIHQTDLQYYKQKWIAKQADTMASNMGLHDIIPDVVQKANTGGFANMGEMQTHIQAIADKADALRDVMVDHFSAKGLHQGDAVADAFMAPLFQGIASGKFQKLGDVGTRADALIAVVRAKKAGQIDDATANELRIEATTAGFTKDSFAQSLKASIADYASAQVALGAGSLPAHPPQVQIPQAVHDTASASISPEVAAKSVAFMKNLQSMGAWQAKAKIATDIGKRLKAAGISNAHADHVYGALHLGAKGQSSDPHEHLVDGIVAAWAGTSADHSVSSVAVQLAANHVFGMQNWATRPGHVPQDTWDAAQAAIADPVVMSTLQHTAHAMYQQTQESFKKAGITHVTLFRGVKYVTDPAVLAAIKQHTQSGGSGAVVATMPKGAITTNPISSFSTNYPEAINFAGSGGTSTDSSAFPVFATTVPVEHIYSHCQSGPGCMGEDEMVVLGHDKPMVMTASTTSGSSAWKNKLNSMITKGHDGGSASATAKALPSFAQNHQHGPFKTKVAATAAIKSHLAAGHLETKLAQGLKAAIDTAGSHPDFHAALNKAVAHTTVEQAYSETNMTWSEKKGLQNQLQGGTLAPADLHSHLATLGYQPKAGINPPAAAAVAAPAPTFPIHHQHGPFGSDEEAIAAISHHEAQNHIGHGNADQLMQQIHSSAGLTGLHTKLNQIKANQAMLDANTAGKMGWQDFLDKAQQVNLGLMDPGEAHQMLGQGGPATTTTAGPPTAPATAPSFDAAAQHGPFASAMPAMNTLAKASGAGAISKAMHTTLANQLQQWGHVGFHHELNMAQAQHAIDSAHGAGHLSDSLKTNLTNSLQYGKGDMVATHAAVAAATPAAPAAAAPGAAAQHQPYPSKAAAANAVDYAHAHGHLSNTQAAELHKVNNTDLTVHQSLHSLTNKMKAQHSIAKAHKAGHIGADTAHELLQHLFLGGGAEAPTIHAKLAAQGVKEALPGPDPGLRLYRRQRALAGLS